MLLTPQVKLSKIRMKSRRFGRERRNGGHHRYFDRNQRPLDPAGDNPAAGTSEVRDPNGALFTSFAHPADSVTLLSRAGQNVTVNLTEPLGTASLIIGSLTSTTVRPDQIFVNRVSTSGNVTLTANQAITEAVGDVGNDIVANQLLLDAGTGIGTSGNPIETQVLQLEGESVTGGIHLSNVGDLTIGGSTAELRGLFTGISGNIALTNSGSIFLADVDNVQSIAGKGDITLTAIGAAADITSIVNNDALFALGDLNLSAGRDILFGTGGLNFDNDVRAGGAIFVTAGDDFHIDGNADMLANDAGTSSNGGIQILVGGDILIEDGTGTSASVAVTTGTGGILLATGAGGTLSLAANSAAAVGAGAGGVVVSADRVLIEADSGITTTGNGAVTITGSSASRNIILGSATDAAAAVELSDAELDRLFTQNAIIGTSLAGQVAVQAAITHPNANLTPAKRERRPDPGEHQLGHESHPARRRHRDAKRRHDNHHRHAQHLRRHAGSGRAGRADLLCRHGQRHQLDDHRQYGWRLPQRDE